MEQEGIPIFIAVFIAAAIVAAVTMGGLMINAMLTMPVP